MNTMTLEVEEKMSTKNPILKALKIRDIVKKGKQEVVLNPTRQKGKVG